MKKWYLLTLYNGNASIFRRIFAENLCEVERICNELFWNIAKAEIIQNGEFEEIKVIPN